MLILVADGENGLDTALGNMVDLNEDDIIDLHAAVVVDEISCVALCERTIGSGSAREREQGHGGDSRRASRAPF